MVRFSALGNLFFVLSGFLITSIILRSLDHPKFLSTFYIRRSLRIFPIYYLTIFITFTLNTLRQHPGTTEGLPYYLFYLQNIHRYWGGETPPVDISLGHTWTLAIEEQFYLFWPFALLLFKRTATLGLSIFLFILPIFLRQFGLDRSVLFGHSDGLALGALLTYIYSNTPKQQHLQRSHLFFLIFIICFSLYWFLWTKVSGNINYTGKKFVANNLAEVLISLSYFGLIGTVVYQAGQKHLAFLRVSWLKKIGLISYGLYLYHWVIYEFLDTLFVFRWGFNHPYWLDLLKLTLSFIVAWGSWCLIEKPMLKLKNKFKY